jgi:hypothetical protein
VVEAGGLTVELPSNALPDGQLPRGVYLYSVDVRSRLPPTLEISGGLTGGSYRDVVLYFDHPDALKGRRDVADLFVWGDVDPNFHPRIAQALVDSAPISYMSRIPIVLSAGAGTKTINVRTRFVSGRTDDASVTFELADDIPHVTILRQDFKKFRTTDDDVHLAWSCSHPVSQVYVVISDSYEALREDCAQITSGTNVNSSGSWAAGEMIESSFSYANALAASASLETPLDQSGQVFVLRRDSVWGDGLASLIALLTDLPDL